MSEGTKDNFYQNFMPRFLAKSLDNLINRLSRSDRRTKHAFNMAIDAVLAVLCVGAAWSLRAGQSVTDLQPVWYLFVMMPVITVTIFSFLGIYRWVIRSTSQRLFHQIAKGSALSALCMLVILYLIPPDSINPRSVFILFGICIFMSASGTRALWRSFFDSNFKGEPIAVYGAGAAGQQLVGMLTNGSQYRPVMFIDDDPALNKQALFGVPVVSGRIEHLTAELDRRDVEKIILAIPSLTSARYHNLVQSLTDKGLSVLTMPGLNEIMTGEASVDEIRDISISDILGRSEVAPNIELMGRRVVGKTVLVTGGGGSIGSEICRQVMKLRPERLIVLDNCEANLYHITEELGRNAVVACGSFKPVLGSVLDKSKLEKLIGDNQVNTVFHAAAYKHVPIVESQPDQGVEVNVFGTLTVLEASIAHHVSDFVLISTDKAVRPTNAMGASKRVAELVLQAKASQCRTTRISMVRFGNVLGSSGSVVPKFKRQILEGGPITLTHPDVTRYFMTIPEASQLVLQASAIAKGGDVFVLDMGDPVRIADLASTMVRLYGKKLRRDTGKVSDIDVVLEGLRPGEKLYEELFISDSNTITEVPKISSTHELWLEWDSLVPALDKLQRFAKLEDMQAIRAILLELAFVGENNAEIALLNGSISLSPDGKQPDLMSESDADLLKVPS